MPKGRLPHTGFSEKGDWSTKTSDSSSSLERLRAGSVPAPMPAGSGAERPRRQRASSTLERIGWLSIGCGGTRSPVDARAQQLQTSIRRADASVPFGLALNDANRVTGIRPGSPAAAAGLQVYDLVVAANGRMLRSGDGPAVKLDEVVTPDALGLDLALERPPRSAWRQIDAAEAVPRRPSTSAEQEPADPTAPPGGGAQRRGSIKRSWDEREADVSLGGLALPAEAEVGVPTPTGRSRGLSRSHSVTSRAPQRSFEGGAAGHKARRVNERSLDRQLGEGRGDTSECRRTVVKYSAEL